nr:hypothetical protein [Geobacter sp.]
MTFTSTLFLRFPSNSPARRTESEYLEEEIPGVTAAGIIRKRRSALAFDCRTLLSSEFFFAMLDKTLPRARSAPFDLVAEESRVHLFLFVHRVQGVEPGLYFLVRNTGDLEELQRECSPRFLWQRVPAAGPLPLFLLMEGECQSEAALAGCGQEIAGDGASPLLPPAASMKLLSAVRAEIGPLPVGIGQGVGEVHDTAWVRAMIETEGMPHLVNPFRNHTPPEELIVHWMAIELLSQPGD